MIREAHHEAIRNVKISLKVSTVIFITVNLLSKMLYYRIMPTKMLMELKTVSDLAQKLTCLTDFHLGDL